MKYASTPDSSAYNVSGKLDIDNSNIIYQEDAPPDLRVVSWPKGKDFDDSEFLKYYAYDKNGGQNSVLYIVENGIDPGNEVSTLRRRQQRGCAQGNGTLGVHPQSCKLAIRSRRSTNSDRR